MNIKKSYPIFFEKTVPYLICLIIPLLITGPFMADLILTVVSMMFIVYCFIKREFSHFNKLYFKIFLFFYFICLLSTALSEYPWYSFPTSLFYIRFAVFVAAFAFILEKNYKMTHYLFYILVAVYVVLVFDSFYQYLTGYNIINIPKTGVRLSSFFGTELIIGSYLVRLMPLLICLFFLNKNFNKSTIKNLLFWFLLYLSFIIIFLSGERSSFFYSILLIIYLMLMLQKNFFKLSILFFFYILSIFLISTSDASINNRMFEQTKKQMELDKEKIIPFSRDHQGHYLIALDLFKKNFIIGIGPKNFRKHCYSNPKYSVSPYSCTTHPHNTYIQLLAETGLIGFFTIFLIFLSILYYSLKHFYLKIFEKKLLLEDYQVCLLGSFLLTLWPIIPTGNFFNNFIDIIYFYPIALFLCKRNMKS